MKTDARMRPNRVHGHLIEHHVERISIVRGINCTASLLMQCTVTALVDSIRCRAPHTSPPQRKWAAFMLLILLMIYICKVFAGHVLRRRVCLSRCWLFSKMCQEMHSSTISTTWKALSTRYYYVQHTHAIDYSGRFINIWFVGAVHLHQVRSRFYS